MMDFFFFLHSVGFVSTMGIRMFLIEFSILLVEDSARLLVAST